ncbi:hypothetical protein C7443_10341 [Plasticicumulans acidivorans]|uniref:Uncharacterized protein n=1 Tax=Plasticicumulans acidivorans TaxID=886464 RepID=A0A317MWX0_9GAMM|nr:hypothetical protein C7443_10341 [Plasticicumulans acidivorans]
MRFLPRPVRHRLRRMTVHAWRCGLLTPRQFARTLARLH